MTPSSQPEAAPPPHAERRRRRRGDLSRLLTAPLSAEAIERHARRTGRAALRRFGLAAAALAVAGGVWLGVAAWRNRAPLLAPRHRPEALCFLLAQVPRFDPPMTIEPDAALVRGRFPARTPPLHALRQVMRFEDDMVLAESRTQVGDYEVATAWLRLPDSGGSHHWLVIGWMEEADLAVCSFRFAGEGPDLSDQERAWGERLQQRILVAENFRAGNLPSVRLRVPRGGGLPALGPKASS